MTIDDDKKAFFQELIQLVEVKTPELLQKISDLEEKDKLLNEEYKELQQKQQNPTFGDLNNFSNEQGLQQSFETKLVEIREKTLEQLKVLDAEQLEAIKQQKTLNEKIKALQEEINQQDKTIVEVEEFREKAHIRLDELQKEKDSLMKVEAIAEPTKSQDWRLLGEEIKTFQSQLERDKQLASLQRQLKEKENEIGNLGQQNAILVTKHMENLGVYDKRHQQDQILIKDYELRIKELTEINDRKPQAVINARSLAEELKDITDVPKSFLGVQDQLTSAEEELAQLRQELKDIKKNHEKQLTEAKVVNEGEVGNVNTQLQQVREQLTNLQAELQHEKDELVKAKEETLIAKQDLENERKDINRIKEEQETSKRQLDELIKQLEEAKKDKEEVSLRVQVLENKTEELGEDISGKLLKIRQLEENGDVASKELIGLKTNLKKLEAEKEDVDSKLIAENTALKEANQNIQQVKSAADIEKEALQQSFKQQLAILEKGKADKVKEVSDSKLQLDETKKHEQQLITQLAELQSKTTEENRALNEEVALKAQQLGALQKIQEELTQTKAEAEKLL